MLRYDHILVALAVLGFGLVLTASAQSVDQRLFRILSTSNDVENSCNFRVRSNLVSTMDRIGFRVRLPNWTLGVSTIPGTGVTNAAVDQTLTLAADLLKQDQGGADVNCCVDINRNGNVATFTPPATMVNGVITNAAEMNAVFAVNADIKIVSQILWCFAPGAPAFAGCADGNSIITVNTFNPPTTNIFTNPATVAHEVGHWSGLGHVAQVCVPTPGQCGTCTDCTDPLANNVMYCRICAGPPNQGIISSAECGNYQTSAQ